MGILWTTFGAQQLSDMTILAILMILYCRSGTHKHPKKVAGRRDAAWLWAHRKTAITEYRIRPAVLCIRSEFGKAIIECLICPTSHRSR